MPKLHFVGSSNCPFEMKEVSMIIVEVIIYDSNETWSYDTWSKATYLENEEMIVAVNAIYAIHCDDHFFIFNSFPQFIYDLFHISLTLNTLWGTLFLFFLTRLQPFVLNFNNFPTWSTCCILIQKIPERHFIKKIALFLECQDF